MLNGKHVDWETLANQLNLQDQVADIEVKCNNIRACYFREIFSRYIQTQPEESCDNSKRKIARALEELYYINEATRLRGLIVGELHVYQYTLS